MHPRLGYVLVLGALVCVLAAPAAAEVDSHARIVRVSYVDGQVQLDRDGSRGLETAFLNMPLAQGSHVATGSDGYAELEFENGSTVRLTPRSELRARELGTRGDSRVSLLDLSQGIAYFNIKGDSDDEFRVLLQGQDIRVLKSARFRIRLQPDSAQISVMKGELQVSGANDVRVKKDETLTLDFQDRGRYFLARSIETLIYDAWNRDRDEYRDRYASSRYGGGARYLYGASDLNYYGSYVNISGYGNCWRPYGVSSAWHPFRDGAWVWYPHWGYVWVSSYPWGWTPYRYGQWSWVSGYNWCWQAGPSWGRWYYYPVIHRRPYWYDWRHGYPPVRRSGGSGGSGGGVVVVVGSGPYQGRRGPNQDSSRRRVVADSPIELGGSHGVGGGGSPGSGGGNRRPSGLTPGIAPNPEVVEQLRRVHGDDFGVGRRREQENADVAASSSGSGGVTPGPSTGPVVTGTPASGGSGEGRSDGAQGPSARRGEMRGGEQRREEAPQSAQPAAASAPAAQPAPPAPQPAPPAPEPARSVSGHGGNRNQGGDGGASARSSGSYGGGSSGYSGGSSATSGGPRSAGPGYSGGSSSSGRSYSSGSSAGSGSSSSGGGSSSHGGGSSASRSSGSSRSSGGTSHSSGSNSTRDPK